MDRMSVEEIGFVYETTKIVAVSQGVRPKIVSQPYSSSPAWKLERLKRLARFWRDALIHPEQAFTTRGHKEVAVDQGVIMVEPGEKVALKCSVGFMCRVVGVQSTGFRDDGLLVKDLKIGGGMCLLNHDGWNGIGGLNNLFNYNPEGQIRDNPVLVGPNYASIELWNAGRSYEQGRVVLLVERLTEKMMEERGQMMEERLQKRQREFEAMTVQTVGMGPPYANPVRHVPVPVPVMDVPMHPVAAPIVSASLCPGRHSCPVAPADEVAFQTDAPMPTAEDVRREAERLDGGVRFDAEESGAVPHLSSGDEPVDRNDPTHRCTVCGALWMENEDGSWRVRSSFPQSCCENSACMVSTLEPYKPDNNPTHRCTGCSNEWRQDAQGSWVVTNGADPCCYEGGCLNHIVLIEPTDSELG